MSSSFYEFLEDDFWASEGFGFDFEASDIQFDDFDDETFDCNPSEERGRTLDSTNVQEEGATRSAPLTTEDTNKSVKNTRMTLFKAGDTVDMTDRARQKLEIERKKTIQSRINELTGEHPESGFTLLPITGIKVLRDRLKSAEESLQSLQDRLQAVEESLQSQYLLLPVDGRSNISTTFEPEEEQQNGDAGMLDGGGDDDSIWDKNVDEQTKAWWSSQKIGDESWRGFWDKNVNEQTKAWWSSQKIGDESWRGFQDHDTAKFQQ
ncbi:hypothetical protein B9479_007755 [Cryptococcus floricola]|uniref:Uncharacterized protein n=1 Tax=Cryptococcus floricola TaxID=2591691 RepID=A0A5D3AJD3_9TREE|nr:hypothetical protein B9479_007755 [Cryptococcus floricola]